MELVRSKRDLWARNKAIEVQRASIEMFEEIYCDIFRVVGSTKYLGVFKKHARIIVKDFVAEMRTNDIFKRFEEEARPVAIGGEGAAADVEEDTVLDLDDLDAIQDGLQECDVEEGPQAEAKRQKLASFEVVPDEVSHQMHLIAAIIYEDSGITLAERMEALEIWNSLLERKTFPILNAMKDSGHMSLIVSLANHEKKTRDKQASWNAEADSKGNKFIAFARGLEDNKTACHAALRLAEGSNEAVMSFALNDLVSLDANATNSDMPCSKRWILGWWITKSSQERLKLICSLRATCSPWMPL